MEEQHNFTNDQVEGVFSDKAKQNEAEAILSDADKAEEMVRKINRKLNNIPFVGEYFADVPTLCLMLGDYVTGKYKEIPFATMLGIVVALAYFLSPIDIVPDFIPVAGLLDDAAVIGFAIQAAHNDIAEYKEWKGL